MDVPLLYLLLGLVAVLIALSGFFAGSETALMALNRYRLRHLAKNGHRGARYAEQLLARPDRLIGMILLGNIAVHSAATAILTFITLRLYGEAWISVAIGVLTFLILIFGEIAPKTYSALYPERVAIPSAYVYKSIQWLAAPFVYIANLFSNGILRLLGVTPEQAAEHNLSTEELRTVVAETGALLPRRHQKMLLSILDLEKSTVEDIMVPRNEIIGIDIEDDWDSILQSLVKNEHTRLPLWRGGIDDLVGIVHLRRVLGLYADQQLNKDTLLALAREPYFVPEGTPLNQQLVNFQSQKRRVGFVVDEYGDIQGLVTLEDILEEIVGEFTSEPTARGRHIVQDGNGYLVEGRVSIRRLNHSMGWKLPLEETGPKTMNGLILEQLETIPEPGSSLQVNGYTLEIVNTSASAVRSLRIIPPPQKTSRNSVGTTDAQNNLADG